MPKGYRCVGLSETSDAQARIKKKMYGWSGRVANGTNSVRGQPLRLNSYEMVDFSLVQDGCRKNTTTELYDHPLNFGTLYSVVGKHQTVVTPGRSISYTNTSGNSNGFNYDHAGPSTNELNTMRADLQKQISRTTMELAVSLKELPESIRMLMQRFKDLLDLAEAARRKDLRAMADIIGIRQQRSFRRRWKKHLERQYEARPGPKGTIGGISGVYLEGVFGWWSAYSEIIATAEFMADLVHNLPREHAYADGPTKDRVLVYPQSSSTWNNHGIYRFRANTRTRMDATYKVSFSTVISSAGLNLASIWHMIPYSFIVNWFGDVASFLKQFELLNTLSDLDCTMTLFTESTASFEGTSKWYLKPGINASFERRPVSGKFSFVRETRSKASLTITAPPLRLPAKTGQYISAIALMAQRIVGHK